jgi:signal transduction histidine kinase
MKNGKRNGFEEKDGAVVAEMMRKTRKTMQSFHHESEDRYEFWAPILRTSYAVPETIGVDEIPSHENDNIIGFVMIAIGKEILSKQLKELLITSIIILILFLVLAFFASYYLAKEISKPLISLIDGVHAIGMGKVAKKISVETRDEIGLLADAFNDMAESLKKREDEVKIMNQELMKEFEQRKMLSKRLIDLLERDREQVAMELHDHIGQILTSIKINLEVIHGKLEPGHAWLEPGITAARERAVQAIKDIKYISRGLKPSVLGSLGLVSSLRELVNEIERNTGIAIKLFTHEIPKKFGKEKELAVYRITQEALNNIIKHTHASKVFISLVVKDEMISLSIEDNGSGFDLEKTMKLSNGQGPLGLLIMRERAEQLYGEFSIESETGEGTHILVEIPT